MGYQVNDEAVQHARTMIDEGNIVLESDWSEVHPSSEAENEHVDSGGWES